MEKDAILSKCNAKQTLHYKQFVTCRREKTLDLSDGNKLFRTTKCNFAEMKKASGGTAGMDVDKPMHAHDIWIEIPDFLIVQSPNKSFGQLKTLRGCPQKSYSENNP
ncbi:hypothetical protein X798_01041 [Onchocerca flexuosa]|uniref:DUF667 domain-containing protein n=2 Tax=Onchocerca flexuosa TaxID=387005 RepID=A0A183H9P5_9BILA|nr:hypothetical protein X798_01041 [Onchocerca flexuosa]VDO39269.1 unnamed protein product [Onchocerca flexuosa]